jgi:homoserine kinase type II
LLGEHAGKPAALFEWVDGDILCQARVTPAHCHEVGKALGTVHQATACAGELGSGRFRVADLERRIDRIRREGPSELQAAAELLRAELAQHASAREPSLPQGLIHGDLFRDNVLWRGQQIAALIDFESASSGSFAYDLAVTMHAWCYGASFDATLVRALVAGYQLARPLAPAELGAFRTEAALAALRFAVTRITDYAMRAAPGEVPLRDYRRFVARLRAVEAGALDDAITAAARGSRDESRAGGRGGA